MTSARKPVKGKRTMSEKRRQALYDAIHEEVMRVRVRAKREDYDADEYDRELYHVTDSIFRSLLNVLGAAP